MSSTPSERKNQQNKWKQASRARIKEANSLLPPEKQEEKQAEQREKWRAQKRNQRAKLTNQIMTTDDDTSKPPQGLIARGLKKVTFGIFAAGNDVNDVPSDAKNSGNDVPSDAENSELELRTPAPSSTGGLPTTPFSSWTPTQQDDWIQADSDLEAALTGRRHRLHTESGQLDREELMLRGFLESRQANRREAAQLDDDVVARCQENKRLRTPSVPSSAPAFRSDAGVAAAPPRTAPARNKATRQRQSQPFADIANETNAMGKSPANRRQKTDKVPRAPEEGDDEEEKVEIEIETQGGTTQPDPVDTSQANSKAEEADRSNVPVDSNDSNVPGVPGNSDRYNVPGNSDRSKARVKSAGARIKSAGTNVQIITTGEQGENSEEAIKNRRILKAVRPTRDAASKRPPVISTAATSVDIPVFSTPTHNFTVDTVGSKRRLYLETVRQAGSCHTLGHSFDDDKVAPIVRLAQSVVLSNTTSSQDEVAAAAADVMSHLKIIGTEKVSKNEEKYKLAPAESCYCLVLLGILEQMSEGVLGQCCNKKQMVALRAAGEVARKGSKAQLLSSNDILQKVDLKVSVAVSQLVNKDKGHLYNGIYNKVKKFFG